MSTVSTHVLDLATGRPAVGMVVRLSVWLEDGWQRLAESVTDANGRITSFPEIGVGRHRLGFQTGDHGNALYPYVPVVFDVGGESEHYHIPLLLSPHGYTTYRGS
ncbi:MAG: hydroxyisourate hydrolase [Actinobacteria bacterium]|nr:hydroxyisourate hydrolase [Actinomycetota bacterium]MCI0544342.1 hydroxyisourate hydrolase [Actinomycetota bacterium]MCI0678310.1 hydroxyisourate hydrolase [Actinomycetota bacterium]